MRKLGIRRQSSSAILRSAKRRGFNSGDAVASSGLISFSFFFLRLFPRPSAASPQSPPNPLPLNNQR